MPPHLSRFQSGPSNVANPYQHQFPGLTGPGQNTNYPPQLGGHPGSQLNPNAQIPSFATNGANVLNLAAAGASFGVGPDASGLASHAARMGFHGAGAAALQQQQQQQQHAQQGHGGVMGDHPARTQAKGRIREVWKHNLEDEMAVLRDLVPKYPYIAMVSGGTLLFWRSHEMWDAC